MLEPGLVPSGMYGLQAVLADTHPSEEKALGFSELCLGFYDHQTFFSLAHRDCPCLSFLQGHLAADTQVEISLSRNKFSVTMQPLTSTLNIFLSLVAVCLLVLCPLSF